MTQNMLRQKPFGMETNGQRGEWSITFPKMQQSPIQGLPLSKVGNIWFPRLRPSHVPCVSRSQGADFANLW